ncbi:FAA hydrolase family protein [Siculibacillus lacustris]|uniref:FAA hydrolase family protein n=1 Tax=Siculibacillus lacustris TaxID=1549641 RepID=A0A4Q9VLX7_9HYPH|nr:fumarylacetoacetate hydrolase family protein [Siculibacillus lacustris]TBW36431.1 FAA hydrolase family protein [Siculibacillus lacustris]
MTVSAPTLLFAPPPIRTVAVVGTEARFPVARIFCVGRNYVEHAKEMGAEVDREAPFYFLKDASAIVASGSALPYPAGTADYHHEIEFVVAIGAEAVAVDAKDAMDAVFGYALGLDMTRRDLQAVAKTKGRPWDLAKNFEQSAVITPIVPAVDFGRIADQRIELTVGETVRQMGRLSDMVWSVPELIAHLSHFYRLGPGDLIYTGTPSGVGAVRAGDRLTGTVPGLPTLEVTIVPAI